MIITMTSGNQEILEIIDDNKEKFSDDEYLKLMNLMKGKNEDDRSRPEHEIEIHGYLVLTYIKMDYDDEYEEYALTTELFERKFKTTEVVSSRLLDMINDIDDNDYTKHIDCEWRAIKNKIISDKIVLNNDICFRFRTECWSNDVGSELVTDGPVDTNPKIKLFIHKVTDITKKSTIPQAPPIV